MGIRIKVPEELLRPTANKAVRYAREAAGRRGWSPTSISSLSIVVEPGIVGITTDREHLFFQERGTKPFLMTSLEGRRVPIGGRVVTVKDVGKPGFVRIPREGRPDQVIWRNQKWRHPGIKPANIMKNAISRAILEDRAKVQREIVRRLSGTR